MFHELRYQFFRAFVSLLPWGTMRTKWLVKKKVFKAVGENFYFCPRKIPADPQYIVFHNNVSVAADVVFCNHDVIYKVLNGMGGGYNRYCKYYGCIEVMDNVFIGSKSVILPDVRIGPNVIVGAGSIVVRDLEPGGIYAGNPAKKIGDFNSILKNRIEWTEMMQEKDDKQVNEYLWKRFLADRG